MAGEPSVPFGISRHHLVDVEALREDRPVDNRVRQPDLPRADTCHDLGKPLDIPRLEQKAGATLVDELGNSADPALKPVAARLVADPNPVVAEAAAWAATRLANAEGGTARTV